MWREDIENKERNGSKMKETKKRKQKPKRMGRETKTRKEHHAE
jgi:hypothetical protein